MLKKNNAIFFVCAVQYCYLYIQSQGRKRKPRVKKGKPRKDEISLACSSPHLSEHTSEEGEVKVCFPIQAVYQTRSGNYGVCSAQFGAVKLLAFLIWAFPFVYTCSRMTELKNPLQRRNRRRTTKRTKISRALQRKTRRGTKTINGQSSRKKRFLHQIFFP